MEIHLRRFINRTVAKFILPVVIVFNTYPASISNQEFNVNLTITGAKAGTNYLRIELYKEGTTNYFGETFNGKDWYSGSDGLSYFPVNITNASTSAIVKGRLGNPTGSEYEGAGNYKLKVKRYTSSGSAANDTHDPVDILVSYDIKTSTPNPTATQDISPIPNQTHIPTNLPSPSVVSTPTLVPSAVVLAKNATQNPTPSLTTTSTSKEMEKENDVSNVSIVTVAGVVFVATSIFMFVAKRVNSYNKRNVSTSH